MADGATGALGCEVGAALGTGMLVDAGVADGCVAGAGTLVAADVGAAPIAGPHAPSANASSSMLPKVTGIWLIFNIRSL
jgi:hypothetical protein